MVDSHNHSDYTFRITVYLPVLCRTSPCWWSCLDICLTVGCHCSLGPPHVAIHQLHVHYAIHTITILLRDMTLEACMHGLLAHTYQHCSHFNPCVDTGTPIIHSDTFAHAVTSSGEVGSTHCGLLGVSLLTKPPLCVGTKVYQHLLWCKLTLLIDKTFTLLQVQLTCKALMHYCLWYHSGEVSSFQYTGLGGTLSKSPS